MSIIEAIIVLSVGIMAGVGFVMVFDKEKVNRSYDFVASKLIHRLTEYRLKLSGEVKALKTEIEELKHSIVRHARELETLETIYGGQNGVLMSTQRVNADEAIVFGRGKEWVYAYTFPTQEHLAIERKKPNYPMKLGMSTQQDVITRINQQVSGNSTALSERAIVRVVFRVNDSRQMESWMHSELKRMGRKVPDSVGVEWYNTNPYEVEQLFRSYVLKFSRLRKPIVE